MDVITQLSIHEIDYLSTKKYSKIFNVGKIWNQRLIVNLKLDIFWETIKKKKQWLPNSYTKKK